MAQAEETAAGRGREREPGGLLPEEETHFSWLIKSIGKGALVQYHWSCHTGQGAE